MSKVNWHLVAIVAVTVLVTIKFRNQIAALIVKVPVVGPFVAV